MKIRLSSIHYIFIVINILTINVYAEESVNNIRIDNHAFFRSYYYTGSSYFHLSPKGFYRKISREHMFVEESDTGEWFQDDNGQVTLISEKHLKDIEAEPLRISMWWPENVKKIPFVKNRLKELLQEKRDSFTSEEIENIEKYGYENSLSRISVTFPIKVITRNQLEDLYAKIEEFENDEKKNYFIVTPLSFKKTTFLLLKNFGIPLCRDLDRIKEEINNLKDESPLVYIYQAVDTQTFEKESETTQEFIFYPEMTEKVRNMINNNEK